MQEVYAIKLWAMQGQIETIQGVQVLNDSGNEKELISYVSARTFIKWNKFREEIKSKIPQT